MLVNCPRCGFSQPNDQYCAQCGVDMQSFKPKEQPFANQVFSNAGVQIGILLIAAVLAALIAPNFPASLVVIPFLILTYISDDMAK